MVTEKRKPAAGRRQVAARRGRPPGRTDRGERTRRDLLDVAVALLAEQGYTATTLRQIAARAGTSHALVYRYFPAKRALVLALYDDLSAELVRRARLRRGRWRTRAMAVLRESLAVLEPHRVALGELTGLLVSRGEDGIFSARTAFSRERVAGVFVDAVRGATDAPAQGLADALGRLLYLAHLGFVLLWLLDRSEGARASRGVVALFERALPVLATLLRVPGVPGLLRRADALLAEALLAPREPRPIEPPPLEGGRR